MTTPKHNHCCGGVFGINLNNLHLLLDNVVLFTYFSCLFRSLNIWLNRQTCKKVAFSTLRVFLKFIEMLSVFYYNLFVICEICFEICLFESDRRWAMNLSTIAIMFPVMLVFHTSKEVFNWNETRLKYEFIWSICGNLFWYKLNLWNLNYFLFFRKWSEFFFLNRRFSLILSLLALKFLEIFRLVVM